MERHANPMHGVAAVGTSTHGKDRTNIKLCLVELLKNVFVGKNQKTNQTCL
jgi:hypothetical protein